MKNSKQVVKKEKGFDFPQDPVEQMRLATEAVFSSWNVKRAVDYRKAANIPDDLGTAVNICHNGVSVTRAGNLAQALLSHAILPQAKKCCSVNIF